MTSQITRSTSIASQVREILIERIVAGDLPSGTPISEPRLAAELGVSRTPLRDALARLEQDRFLRAEPGRGFFVAELSAREANELYPILASLEVLALQSGGIPTPAVVKELTALNQKLSRARSTPDRVRLNTEWHELLLAKCENERLKDLLDWLRHQINRYEYAYFRADSGRLAESIAFHDRIIARLRARDVEGACDAVRTHWLSNLGFLE